VVRRAEVWHGKQAIGTVQVVLSMVTRNAQMAQSILVLVLSQILLFLQFKFLSDGKTMILDGLLRQTG
jgi:hypothetical protein